MDYQIHPEKMSYFKTMEIAEFSTPKLENKNIVSINPKIIPYGKRIYINGIGEVINSNIDGINISDNKIHVYKENYSIPNEKTSVFIFAEPKPKPKPISKPQVKAKPKKNTVVIKSVTNKSGVKVADTKIKLYSKEDLDVMSRIISAEAGCEDDYGQRLVGWVILNRIKSKQFFRVHTIKEVVYAPGQFQPVDNKTIDNPPVKSAVENAKYVLTNPKPPEVPDNLLYFHAVSLGNTNVGDEWWDGVYTKFVHGGHVFAVQI